MDLQQLIKNFPWRRFGTPYETNAHIVKQSIVKILDGAATEKDYQNLIYSFESQAWLIKLSPWGMRFYLALLEEDKADKAILLRDMLTLFEAANYSSQSPQAEDFKATKGKVAKYETYKEKLFNDAYDGTMDEEFLKLVGKGIAFGFGYQIKLFNGRVILSRQAITILQGNRFLCDTYDGEE